jgi:hypothetical protein
MTTRSSTGDWVESTRQERFGFYALVPVVAAATFATRGLWLYAFLALALGLGSLWALWWFLGAVRRAPALGIDKSLRKVGARKGGP